MLLIIALLTGALLSCELAVRLPLASSARGLVANMRRAGEILLSRTIGPARKERLIPGYALRIFRFSLGMLALTIIAMVPLIVAARLVSHSLPEAIDALGDPSHAMPLTAFCMLYLIMRIRTSSDRTLFRH